MGTYLSPADCRVGGRHRSLSVHGGYDHHRRQGRASAGGACAIAAAICRFCSEPINFETTHLGNRRPINEDGEIHFVTCSARQKIRPPVPSEHCACDCPGHNCWHCRRNEHIRELLPAATEDQLGLED